MKLPVLKQIDKLKGRRVLLRLDLNVPIVRGAIEDDFRIQRVLPTLSCLKAQGTRTIIISHIENAETNSLEKVSDYLAKIIPLTFVKTLDEAKIQATKMAEGECLLLENLRLWDGEKQNDDSFAKELAGLGEIYVNDAFAVSHRNHASVVAITKYLPSYAGFLFQEEFEHLSQVFNPPRPFLFVLGGAKFETKMPLIEKFLKLADRVFVGGALANDFFQAKGLEVGKSVVSVKKFDLSALLKDEKLILPLDVVTGRDPEVLSKLPDKVSIDEYIFDAGPKTLKVLRDEIKKAKFVLWNGPLGDYEKGFKDGTEKLATFIAESSAESIVGGGDTRASIKDLGLEKKITFVSTGGGAMLQFLIDETLPGIRALSKT
jgi:phosphoglycerate kinase